MDDRGLLFRAKLSLAGIALGIGLSGGGVALWPFAGWTMYRHAGAEAPGPGVSDLELRVVDRTGAVHVLAASRVLGYEWNDLARHITRSACGAGDPLLREGHRAYLSRVLARRLPGVEIETVQCWQLDWDVDPMGLPPLDRASPVRQAQVELLGRGHDEAGRKRLVNVRERLGAAIDARLTTPRPNAAGRLGLFRIFYSLFFLWHLSQHHAEDCALPGLVDRVLVVRAIPFELSPTFFQVLESLVAGSLVLLLIGLGVRVVTTGLLVGGGLLEAFYTNVDPEKATAFLTFYIPLFMLLHPGWGDTYSLDALLRRRAGEPRVDPTDASWRYLLPARSALFVLGVLFLNAAIFKLLGSWLVNPPLVANLLLEKNVTAALVGFPVNPFAPFVALHPLVYNGLRFGVLAFEGLFPLFLLHPKLQRAALSAALLFHAFNALWMAVTFTPILVVYGLFVDWQAIRARLLPRTRSVAEGIPSVLLVAGTLSLTAVVAVSWNLAGSARFIFDLGGLLDWRTIWYPVLPLALLSLGQSTVDLFSRRLPR